jgi:hypothetical protein
LELPCSRGRARPRRAALQWRSGLPAVGSSEAKNSDGRVARVPDWHTGGFVEPPCSGTQASRQLRAASSGILAVAWPTSLVAACPHGFMPARVQRWPCVAPCLHRAALQWQSGISAVTNGHPRHPSDRVARVPGGRTGDEPPCSVALKCPDGRKRPGAWIDSWLARSKSPCGHASFLFRGEVPRGWGRIVV